MTQITTATRFVGRVGTVPHSTDSYGFITLSTVEHTDGSPHNLLTTKDIFIHQDDCSVKLKPGLQVEFDAVHRIGHAGEFRATAAIELLDAELVPLNETTIPGFSVPLQFNPATEIQIANTKLPIHFRMKVVPAATVEQVVKNKPMPTIPRQFGRGTPEEEGGLLNAFLLHLFPAMAQFGADFNVIDSQDGELDSKVQQASEDLASLGMSAHVSRMQDEVGRFKATRNAIKFTAEEGLVRPDTIVPIRYLPDLFMAVPVWFYYADSQNLESIKETNTNNDPRIHPWTKHFCDLFPDNRRWADTFQLYNRRMRSLADYGGEGFDVIPPVVARRLRWAIKAFDFVVIATPYHDLAARDWQNLQWLRSIDPYVLGFKKGIPYFFILARFSDSGTFPLYHQLVGDTIEFLRNNLHKLDGFNRVDNPYWHQGVKKLSGGNTEPRLGDHLKYHAESLLQAFEQGNLFDWLRMEDVNVLPSR